MRLEFLSIFFYICLPGHSGRPLLTKQRRLLINYAPTIDEINYITLHTFQPILYVKILLSLSWEYCLTWIFPEQTCIQLSQEC